MSACFETMPSRRQLAGMLDHEAAIAWNVVNVLDELHASRVVEQRLEDLFVGLLP